MDTINLPDAVPLGGAYDGGRASPVGLQGHVMLQGAVGFEQQQQCRQFVLKAEIAVSCA